MGLWGEFVLDEQRLSSQNTSAERALLVKSNWPHNPTRSIRFGQRAPLTGNPSYKHTWIFSFAFVENRRSSSAFEGPHFRWSNFFLASQYHKRFKKWVMLPNERIGQYILMTNADWTSHIPSFNCNKSDTRCCSSTKQKRIFMCACTKGLPVSGARCPKRMERVGLCSQLLFTSKALSADVFWLDRLVAHQAQTRLKVPSKVRCQIRWGSRKWYRILKNKNRLRRAYC